MPAPYHTPRATRLAALSERDEIESALSTFSDMHKEVFGTRPREIIGALRTAGIRAIDEEIDSLVEYSEGEDPTEGEGWRLS